MHSARKNVAYNTAYQILTLIIPFITAPYLSRAIGVSGVGTYSYTYSIVYYFMLVCLLGLNNYGNRKIAQVRDNSDRLKQAFWSIYAMQLITGILALIVYIVFAFFISEYQQMSLLLMPFLFSSILDINWFFFGIENFKTVITRNTIVKVLSLVLIFMFVKTPDDLWKYALIMSVSTLISQVIMWPLLFKKVSFYLPRIKGIKEHIKPNLMLFIPVVAVSVYKIMDKVMLGMMSGVTEVGYYENAEKVVHIPVVVIAALGTAMLPRMSNVLAKGRRDVGLVYIKKSMRFLLFLSFPMMFGLMAISHSFVPLYFGDEFLKTSDLIILLSITLPFLSFANVIRTQFLIPTERDTVYIKSVLLGAIINFIVNMNLIPDYSAVGACIGTIVAEFAVMLYQTIAVNKLLPIVTFLGYAMEYLLKSVAMFLILTLIGGFNMSVPAKIAIQVISGIGIYTVFNYKYLMTVARIKIKSLR